MCYRLAHVRFNAVCLIIRVGNRGFDQRTQLAEHFVGVSLLNVRLNHVTVLRVNIIGAKVQ